MLTPCFNGSSSIGAAHRDRRRRPRRPAARQGQRLQREDRRGGRPRLPPLRRPPGALLGPPPTKPPPALDPASSLEGKRAARAARTGEHVHDGAGHHPCSWGGRPPEAQLAVKRFSL